MAEINNIHFNLKDDDKSSKNTDKNQTFCLINSLENIVEALKNNDKNLKNDPLSLTINKLASKFGLSKIQDRIGALSGTDLEEPILNPTARKFTAFPINYKNIWDLYKKQQACFWKAEEIDFVDDYDDFLTLNKDEQHFIEMILAFFAASDGIVNFNLSERFLREVKISEAQTAYSFQMMMENIHSETYSLMLDNIVRDPKRRNFLFRAIETVPAVKKMADWAFKWINSSKSFAHRVVAFAVVEGVFFSGMFAAIFWLKKYKNIGKEFMNGLTKSNKFISRDERLHCEFACEIYKLLKYKLPAQEINEIIIEAVKISQNFMTDALPVRLIGMNCEQMKDYIAYIGDRLLGMLGYKKIFKKKNPFGFMKTIGLSNKTNFHEGRPDEYQDAHVMNIGKEISKINIEKIDELDF
jgi:ribonucleoside-diphosphate reductase subunit M2